MGNKAILRRVFRRNKDQKCVPESVKHAFWNAFFVLTKVPGL